MSPILDSIGSIKGYGWGSFSLPSSFESIATVNGNGSASTYTFSSIPSTYKHLQVRFMLRDTYGGASTFQCRVQLNGVTSDTYTTHRLIGNGTSAAALVAINNQIILGQIEPNGGSLANTYAVGIIDIHDYESTTKFKTVRAFTGVNANNTDTAFTINLISGLYQATTAVTSLSIDMGAAATTASVFSLYGIKGA